MAATKVMTARRVATIDLPGGSSKARSHRERRPAALHITVVQTQVEESTFRPPSPSTKKALAPSPTSPSASHIRSPSLGKKSYAPAVRSALAREVDVAALLSDAELEDQDLLASPFQRAQLRFTRLSAAAISEPSTSMRPLRSPPPPPSPTRPLSKRYARPPPSSPVIPNKPLSRYTIPVSPSSASLEEQEVEARRQMYEDLVERRVAKQLLDKVMRSKGLGERAGLGLTSGREMRTWAGIVNAREGRRRRAQSVSISSMETGATPSRAEVLRNLSHRRANSTGGISAFSSSSSSSSGSSSSPLARNEPSTPSSPTLEMIRGYISRRSPPSTAGLPPSTDAFQSPFGELVQEDERVDLDMDRVLSPALGLRTQVSTTPTRGTRKHPPSPDLDVRERQSRPKSLRRVPPPAWLEAPNAAASKAPSAAEMNVPALKSPPKAYFLRSEPPSQPLPPIPTSAAAPESPRLSKRTNLDLPPVIRSAGMQRSVSSTGLATVASLAEPKYPTGPPSRPGAGEMNRSFSFPARSVDRPLPVACVPNAGQHELAGLGIRRLSSVGYA